ncbi:MAG: hypothetical protein BGN86_16220 [Caulobacterales bacterium 68-7]|nr:porin family protein [Caulobacterales bacterium]OJU12190.1 MAG: hypothetical protein BGN86_16220 [Caulobacterales bacterium 68-7]
MKLSMLVGAAAVSVAALAALPAAAQTSFYGNVGYTAIDAEDVTLGALTGRVGAQFHPNFAVEGEAGFGVKDDSANVGGVNIKGELKHSVAVYGVGILPINDKFDLLARVGYGTSKLEASALGTSVSDSQESWNYGVGAQYSFDGANGVRVDYTRYDFNGDYDKADTWAVSYVRKF